MDLEKVLQQLHEELENLNAAISSLERLQEASKHSGKEAEWLEDLSVPVPAARKRKSKAKKDDVPNESNDSTGSSD